MSESYMVRCTAATGGGMKGIYAAGLTATGMVATWKPERATRYDSYATATGVAARLGRKFCGTVWTAIPETGK